MGQTAHVDNRSALRSLDVGAGTLPVYLPIGDFNGDEIPDFIGGLVPDGSGNLLAKVYFGTQDITDPEFAKPDSWLSFEEVYEDGMLLQHEISHGDFNGDGISDIAMIGGNRAVYIVLGRSSEDLARIPTRRQGLPSIHVEEMADIVLDSAQFTSVTNVGDQNGDGVEDLALLDGQSLYLMYGDAGWQVWSLVDDLYNVTFTDAQGNSNLDGFQFVADTIYQNDRFVDFPNLWGITNRRAQDSGHTGPHSLYFGNESIGSYATTPASRVHGRAYREFDLTQFPVGTELTFSFSYWLDTENPAGSSPTVNFDQVRVNIAADESFPFGLGHQTLIANHTGIFEQRLGEFGQWRTASVDFSNWAGQVVYIGFEFDSMDALYNNFEGFYVDDVSLRVRQVRLSSEDLVTFAGLGAIGVQAVAALDDLIGTPAKEVLISQVVGAPVYPGEPSHQLLVFSYSSSWTAGATVEAASADRVWLPVDTSNGFGISGHYLMSAGNVVGDATSDLIVGSHYRGQYGRSAIIDGAMLGAPQTGPTTLLVNLLARGPLVPLGDFDGLAGDDLGISDVRISRSVSQTTDQVFFDSAIYLSSNESELNIGFEQREIIFNASQYFGGNSNPFTIWASGYVNDAGRPIVVVIGSGDGNELVFYEGKELVDIDRSEQETPRFAPATYEMARPLTDATRIEVPTRIDLTDPATTTHDVLSATSMTGTQALARLGAGRSIGDINGDGKDDWAFDGAQHTYIVYGPLSILSGESIEDAADLVISKTENGGLFQNLADSLGDLNGDGINDLLFYRRNPSSSSTLQITYVLGQSTTLPRNLNSIFGMVSGAEGVQWKTRDTLISGLAASVVQVFAAKWNNQSAFDDVVVFTASESFSNTTIFPRLRVFEGMQFTSNDTLTPLLSLGEAFPDRYSGTRGLAARNVGDLNGDGRDDVVVSTELISSLEPLMLERRAFIVQGGATGTNTITWTNASTILPLGNTGSAVGSPPIMALGDIGSQGSSAPDGYDDFAIYNPAARELLVYRGSPTTVSTEPMRIRANSTSSGVLLSATAGDFNGDGLVDLAVLETLSNADGQLLSGTTYILWDIATKPAAFTLADQADVRLTSNPGGGLLDRISSTSFNDVNGDGVSDLLLASTLADVSLGNGFRLDAGRSFVIQGLPERATISDDFDVLTNRTITGSGDYVVDKANGKAAVFDGLQLTSEKPEKVYRISTLGDGLPGNSISVSPWAAEPVSLRSTAHGTYSTFLRDDFVDNAGFDVVPNSLTGQGLLPSNWQTISQSPDTYSNNGSYGLPPNFLGNFAGVTAQQGIRWVAGGSFGRLPGNTNPSSITMAESFGTFLPEPLEAGVEYKLSGYLHQALRSDLNHAGGYHVFLAQSGSAVPLQAGVYLGRFDPTTANSWQAREFTFTAPANAASMTFLAFAPYQVTAGQIAYPGLDNLSLQETRPRVTSGSGSMNVSFASPFTETGYIEYDLSSVLHLRDNPDRIGQALLELDYTSTIEFNQPFSLAGDLNWDAKNAIAVGERYFTIMRKSGVTGTPQMLWVSDGSVVGTKSISAGLYNGEIVEFDAPYQLHRIDSDLYFNAESPMLGFDSSGLWRLAAGSDVPVRVSGGISNIEQLIKFGELVVVRQPYYSPFLFDPANLQAGLSSIPGTDGWYIAGPVHAVEVDGTPNLLFFGSSYDDANNVEGETGLVRFALGSTVPVLVSNSFAPTEFSYGQFANLTQGGEGEVYYMGANGDGSNTLYKLTSLAGQWPVEAIVFDSGAPDPNHDRIVSMGDMLFVTNGGTLHRLDFGSSVPHPIRSSSGVYQQLRVVEFASGPRLLFRHNDSETVHQGGSSIVTTSGEEPWISDGTVEGTKRLSDLNRVLEQSNDPDDGVTYTRGSTQGSSPQIAGGAFFDGYYYFAATSTLDEGNTRLSLVRTDGTEAGTSIVLGITPQGMLAAIAGGLFVPGREETLDPDGLTELFVADDASSSIRALRDRLGMTLTAEALLGEGDFAIDMRDVQDVARFETSTRVDSSTGIAALDLTEAVQEALRSGRTRLTIRLSSTDQNPRLTIAASPVEGIGASQTRLRIEPTGGVLMDVMDADGRLLSQGQAVVDMRNMDAGDYFIRVYSPTAVTTPQPFQVEIAAPLPGQNRELYGTSDRDRIYGGDGNDVIYGNRDFDRLYGGTGRDLFVADRISGLQSTTNIPLVVNGPEIRDYSASEDYQVVDVAVAESLAQFSTLELDPIIDVQGPLLSFVAARAGIAITDSGQLSRPARASDMASLVWIDLAYQDINDSVNEDLEFLRYAVNVRSLNLAGNPGVFSLNHIQPSRDEETGEQLGARQLEYLAIDGTEIDSLYGISELTKLKGLTIDHAVNFFSYASLAPFRNLTMLSLDLDPADTLSWSPLDTISTFSQLQSLSLRNRGLNANDVRKFARLDNLKYLYLDGNRIEDIGWIVGQSRRTQASTMQGVWTSNINLVSAADGGDYAWVDGTQAPAADPAAVWAFSMLQPGTYEVWTTWLPHDDRATNASYSLWKSNGETGALPVQTPLATVNQRFTPQGVVVDERAWQQIGEFEWEALADASNFFTIELSALGDGIIIADGLRLVRKEATLPNLKEVSLVGNPLNNVSHDEFLPVLVASYEDPGTPFPEVRFTPNEHAPVLQSISNQIIFGGQSLTIPLFATDEDGDDIAFEVVGLPPSQAWISGSVLHLSGFTAGLPYASPTITVTATDSRDDRSLGRTATQSFDLLVQTLSTRFFNVYGRKLDTSEQAVEGWVVSLDTNQDGEPEYWTQTDRNGDYAFRNIPYMTGPWEIGEVVQPGWTPSNPGQGPMLIDVASYNASSNYLINFNLVSEQLLSISAMQSGEPVSGTVNEGSSIQFSALASPTIGVDVLYLWRVDGEVLGDQATLTWSPGNEGRYQIELTAEWHDGTANRLETVSYDLFALNVIPTNVSAGGPYNINEGDELPLTASAEDVDQLLLYQWEIDIHGNGNFTAMNGVTGESPTLDWDELRDDFGFAGGPSQRTIRVRVSDDGGATWVASMPVLVSIANAAPVANAGGPYTISEGNPLTLNAGMSFDYGEPTEGLAYAWDIDGDGDFDEQVFGINPTLTWSQLNALGILGSGPGRTIRVRVTDSHGAAAINATSLMINNTPPVITTMAPALPLVERDTLTMQAAWIDPGLDDTHQILWTVSLGGSVLHTSTALTLNYLLPDNGVYTVQLRVTDSDGGSDIESWDISVDDFSPVATVAIPATAVAGASFDITISDLVDSVADLAASHTLWLDINNDGVFETVGSLPTTSVTINEQGTYPISVRLTDTDGGQFNTTRSIVILNAAPTAEFALLTAGTIIEGDTVTIGFTNPFDPSTEDTIAGFTYSFDLDNDGIYELSGLMTSSQQLTIPNHGTTIVRGRISDRWGASSEYVVSFVVDNAPPIIASFTASSERREGHPVMFSGSFSDPGADVWSARALVSYSRGGVPLVVALPVGLNADKSFSFQYQFPTDLPDGYQVAIEVGDGQAVGAATLEVIVDNVAPQIATQSNGQAFAGLAWTRQIAFTDPGLDTWSWTVDYGNGTTVIGQVTSLTKQITLSHVYATAGTKTVVVTLSDGTDTSALQFDMEVSVNTAPTIVEPIADLQLIQGLQPRSFHADLYRVFRDAEEPSSSLQFAVTGNTNATLVQPVIENGKLLLVVSPAHWGVATIEVTATDAVGNATTDTFVLTVLAQDTTAPVSSIAPMPSVATSLAIPVLVQGADPSGPAGSFQSGILSYDLYVAEGNGEFQWFATVPTVLPTTLFYAQSNRTYFFRSVARDMAGNAEQKPVVAEAQIVVGDLDPPSTQVISVLPDPRGLFKVNMTGTDTGGGLLRFFDLYVSVDEGTAEYVGSVSAGSPNASGVYAGSTSYQAKADGLQRTYRFFSIGRDSTGNVERAPDRPADVVVTIAFADSSLRATGIDVQLGGQQRSYINVVDVLFSSEAGLAELLLLNPLRVEKFALDAVDVTPGTGTEVTGFTAQRVGNRLRMDFGIQGITGNRSSNDGDGFYRVLVDGNVDGDYADEADAFFEFARILGDANGDFNVTLADRAVVNSQLGRTGKNLNGDVDGSGSVNATDRSRVNAQINLNRRLVDDLRGFLDD